MSERFRGVSLVYCFSPENLAQVQKRRHNKFVIPIYRKRKAIVDRRFEVHS